MIQILMIYVQQNALHGKIYSSKIIFVGNKNNMTERRKLRSGGACQQLQNIFLNEHYKSILPTTLQHKICKTPIINCENINSLKIEPNSDHQQNLRLMKQVILQFTDVKQSNNDKFYESEQEQNKKIWKKNEVQYHQYGEQMLNMNFLKEIDQFIME